MLAAATALPPEADTRAFDNVVFQLALDQHGRVARWQLLEAGMPDWAIENRRRSGVLHTVRPGVYSLGEPRKSWKAALMTAVLAAGPGAVVSHWSAVALHCPEEAHVARIHVTIPRRGGMAAPDLRIHHARRLDGADVTTIDGIPVTTLERTVLDIAETEHGAVLGRLVHELEVERRLDVDAIDAVLLRNRGRRGAKPLGQLLERYRPREKAAIQRRLYRLVRKAGFPPTEQDQIFETPARVYELDIYFAQFGLCFEADGYKVHGTRKRFVGDRRKDRALWLAGIIVHRYTWDDVTRNAEATLEELKAIRARFA